jgi:cardiolipin hydrolase
MKRLTILALILALFWNFVQARTYFTPGKECEEEVIKSIDLTEKTLDIAIYSITNEAITNAIIRAFERGVRVRILTDYTQSKVRGSKALFLKESGVEIKLNSKHKIEHNKFAIFDGIEVETGSYNYTQNATKGNSENCHFLKKKQDVKKYKKRFNELWQANSWHKSEERFLKMKKEREAKKLL